ncbi:MAG: hypothetical protein HDT47_01000 [Ruminococcaceae bacterium]|nr:hypothetical protein [Oscillospiraceae bacterium]
MKKFKAIAAISAVAAASVLAASVSADFLIPTGATTTTALADIYEEDNGAAWIKVFNQWNETSMYTIMDIDDDTKDIIIKFEVENCDGSYQAFAGFGINGWTPSVWNEETYRDAIGGIPNFTIDHDGEYELIVPFGLFMAATPFADEETGGETYKEYLESIDGLELVISGISENTTTVVTVKDVIQSPVAHSFAECELTGTAAPSGSEDNGAAASSDAPADNTGNTNTSAGADKSNADTGVEGAAGLIGVSMIAAVVLCVAGKKRK